MAGSPSVTTITAPTPSVPAVADLAYDRGIANFPAAWVANIALFKEWTDYDELGDRCVHICDLQSTK